MLVAYSVYTTSNHPPTTSFWQDLCYLVLTTLHPIADGQGKNTAMSEAERYSILSSNECLHTSVSTHSCLSRLKKQRRDQKRMEDLLFDHEEQIEQLKQKLKAKDKKLK